MWIYLDSLFLCFFLLGGRENSKNTIEQNPKQGSPFSSRFWVPKIRWLPKLVAKTFGQRWLMLFHPQHQMTPKIREDDGFFTTSFEKKPGVVFYLFPALSHISHFSQGMETLWVWNVFLHLVPWRNRRFWMTFLKSFFFLWQRYPIVNVDGSERNPVSCWWPVIYDGFLYIIHPRWFSRRISEASTVPMGCMFWLKYWHWVHQKNQPLHGKIGPLKIDR